jgi:hypothetical protein
MPHVVTVRAVEQIGRCTCAICPRTC